MSNERVAFLNEVGSFLNESKNYVSSVLSQLGWSEDIRLRNSNNTDEGLCEEGMSEIGDFKSEFDDKCDVTKDSETLFNEIVGSLPQPVKKEKEKSILEILAHERDMKRRRTSYKGRIHTKHKSQNEILREVIAQQMEAFEELVSNDTSEAINTVNQPNKEVTTETINVGSIRVPNPHLLWKSVKYEVEMRERRNSLDKIEERHGKEDSKRANSYRENYDKNTKSHTGDEKRTKLYRDYTKSNREDEKHSKGYRGYEKPVYNSKDEDVQLHVKGTKEYKKVQNHRHNDEKQMKNYRESTKQKAYKEDKDKYAKRSRANERHSKRYRENDKHSKNDKDVMFSKNKYEDEMETNERLQCHDRYINDKNMKNENSNYHSTKYDENHRHFDDNNQNDFNTYNKKDIIDHDDYPDKKYNLDCEERKSINKYYKSNNTIDDIEDRITIGNSYDDEFNECNKMDRVDNEKESIETKNRKDDSETEGRSDTVRKKKKKKRSKNDCSGDENKRKKHKKKHSRSRSKAKHSRRDDT